VKTLVVVALSIGALLLGRALRRRPDRQRWVAMGIGILPFFLISLNVMSHETYRGSSRGFEVTLLDLLAWAMLVALPRSERLSKTRTLYLLVCAASAGGAAVPLYSMFGMWKVMRMYLVAAAAYRIVRAGLGGALLQGIVLGQCYAFTIALEQRYLLGLHQVTGPFAHQNGLAQAGTLVFALCLSVLLGRGRNRWATIGTLAALGSVVMTLSRGGLAMTVLSAIVIFLLAAFRYRNPRLLRVAAVGVLLAVVVVLRAGDTIVERFSEAPDASAEARHHFEDMAAMMLDDHPNLGVGLNHYSHANVHDGYADAAKVPEIDRGGVAHHVYWLTLAELGYVGLIAFLLVYMLPVLRGLRETLRAGRTAAGDVIQGMSVGVAAILFQGTLEYTLRLTMVSQIVWCYFGVLGALCAAHSVRLGGIRPAPR
jgi:O-antigen ligase